MNLKLKAKIIERYGSQVDFSEAIGIDETLISKVVRGRRTLSPEKQLDWMATKAGISVETYNLCPDCRG